MRHWVKKWVGRFFITMLMAAGFSAFGVVVPGLSAADMPVVDRSSQTFRQALPNAIGLCLVKMSGNTSVMTLPAIQNAVTDPQRFVTSYSYQQNNATNAKTPWILHVQFDQAALRRLLQQSGQAIWSANRPKALMWLSVPQEDQTGILASGDQSNLATQIQTTADNRGLPYLLPTMDLQDQANVPSDVSQLPSQAALQAEASRYGVESVLASAITPNDDNSLQASWILILDGSPYTWQQQGDDVGTLLQDGINNAANMMANRYATLTSKALETNVVLQVSGVAGLEDYSRVIDSLRRLTPVGGVKVVDLNQDNLLLNVDVSGGSEVLVQALKMLSQFQPDQAAAANPTQTADLYYQYGFKK